MDDILRKLAPHHSCLRARSRLGKYRVEARLAEGYYSNVFRAYDTIEGIRVALKIPHFNFPGEDFLKAYRHEARFSAKIEHPRILKLKDASVIGEYFVMAYPLGIESLAQRLSRRVSNGNLAIFVHHAMEALAYLHQHRIVHCDIKPENFIVRSGPSLCLTDLGIARIAARTINSSGSGTVGYMAPEQAMGKPSARSDVFSLGLLIYQMITGVLPEYPFEWPPPSYAKLSRKAHPQFIALIRKSLEVQAHRRFPDANAFYEAYLRIADRAIHQ